MRKGDENVAEKSQGFLGEMS